VTKVHKLNPRTRRRGTRESGYPVEAGFKSAPTIPGFRVALPRTVIRGCPE